MSADNELVLRLLRAVAKPLDRSGPPCPSCGERIRHALPGLAMPAGYLPDSDRAYFYCRACGWHGSE